MQISIERIIQEGDISPLRWNMNGEDIAYKLPHSYPLIQKYRQGNYSFLDLDGVEFYFKEDFYLRLTQLIIQAWRIKPKVRSRFFNFSWLHQKLTYDKVLRNLERLDWAFTEYSGYQKEPVLLVENRALFRFYDIPEPNGTYVLSKVVILHPQDTQLVIDQLGKLPYEMIQASWIKAASTINDYSATPNNHPNQPTTDGHNAVSASQRATAAATRSSIRTGTSRRIPGFS